MEQFEIHRIFSLDLFGHDISFTNSSLLMVIALFAVTAFMVFAMRSRSLVPSRLQSLAEITYEYVAGMVKESLGEEGMKYFPWIFSIFIFILFTNWAGLIPGVGTIGWGHTDAYGHFHLDKPLFRGGNADLNMTFAMSAIFFAMVTAAWWPTGLLYIGLILGILATFLYWRMGQQEKAHRERLASGSTDPPARSGSGRA